MKMIFVLLLMFVIPRLDPVSSQIQAIRIVKIEGMKFVPKTIEIKVGEKIQWVNESSNSHNVVEANNMFISKMLSAKGNIFEYTFTTEGTFNYYCQPHKLMGMTGIVKVSA